MQITRRLALGALACAAAATSLPALAQTSYATRTVTIVVAYPAGGDTDAMARLFAEKLAPRLGQPVVVENRAGASGTIGTAHVARSAPDGHTLLLAPSTFSIAPLVLKGRPAYDVLGDLTPIIKVGNQPMFLVAGPAARVSTFAEFKTWAAQPGQKLVYGSPGSGSPMHVLGEMFNHASGIKMEQVPYRGIAPVITDMMGGHIPMTWVTLGPVAPYLADNRMRVLAVADNKRSPLAPNVPTLAEVGVKDVEVTAWQGLMGPKGLPAPVVATLNAHMNDILKMPDVVQRLRDLGILPEGGTPEVLARTNASDYARFGKVITQFGIQAD